MNDNVEKEGQDILNEYIESAYGTLEGEFKYAVTESVLAEFRKAFPKLLLSLKGKCLLRPERFREVNMYEIPKLLTHVPLDENLQIKGAQIKPFLSIPCKYEEKVLRINYIEARKAAVKEMLADPFSQCRKLKKGKRERSRYLDFFEEKQAPEQQNFEFKIKSTFFCGKGAERDNIIRKRKELVEDSIFDSAKNDVFYMLFDHLWEMVGNSYFSLIMSAKSNELTRIKKLTIQRKSAALSKPSTTIFSIPKSPMEFVRNFYTAKNLCPRNSTTNQISIVGNSFLCSSPATNCHRNSQQKIKRRGISYKVGIRSIPFNKPKRQAEILNKTICGYRKSTVAAPRNTGTIRLGSLMINKKIVQQRGSANVRTKLNYSFGLY